MQHQRLGAARKGIASPRDRLEAVECPLETVDAPDAIRRAAAELEPLVRSLTGTDAPFRLRRGERMAQLVVAPVTRIRWEERTALAGTARGAGGFGSTGEAAR